MTAIEAGAGSVIGFDFDQTALDLGFSRSQETGAPFLPLFLDAANPSPGQGWAAKERKGLQDRATADGLLALAFVHHMAIAKNIPLKGLLSWLTGFAPQGVIEFIPKSDAMVQELLRLRKDIFEDYTEEAFFGYLQEFATVERSLQVSQSGRKLVWYRR
jgi:ribosomal protein L11 methylase PrmA